jgi:uncharacterized alkaline shock family protein YloU
MSMSSANEPSKMRAPTATAEREATQARPEDRPAGGVQEMGVTGVALRTETGITRIADSVVAKIAGLAARDIPGVFAMGTGMARRVGQLRSLIPGSSDSSSALQGVAVEVGEREAAIDLNLVTWYGQSIVDISDAVRRNCIGQVEGMTGLKVVEVNIQIDDIHVESDDSQKDQPQRVQ